MEPRKPSPVGMSLSVSNVLSTSPGQQGRCSFRSPAARAGHFVQASRSGSRSPRQGLPLTVTFVSLFPRGWNYKQFIELRGWVLAWLRR